jgi:hypothetical protein
MVGTPRWLGACSHFTHLGKFSRASPENLVRVALAGPDWDIDTDIRWYLGFERLTS